MTRPLNRPTGLRLGLARTVVALCAVLLLSACDFSVYKLPLPGGADTGEDPMVVTVEFPDVLDLVPQSTVKVNDVTVGKVTDIQLNEYDAEVELTLRRDVDLPANALAEIRQTSLLGEKFVSLSPPDAPSSERLDDGDRIGLEATNRNPEVEEVLGALSLLLNGGGVAQLKTIASELNLALEGREDSARSVLNQIRVFMRELDDNKGAIVTAIEQVNRLAVTANRQKGTIESALDDLPAALDSLDGQREDLVRMLQALNRLGNVGTRVIKASKTATIDTLTRLQPVLTELAASGDDLADSFHVFLTYPFVDEVVGRDPNVARNLHMGDYTNLSIQLDVKIGEQDPGSVLPDLPEIPDPVEAVCITIRDLRKGTPIPDDLSELCDGARELLAECSADPTECPRFLERRIRDLGKAACEDLGLPATLCSRDGGGGGGDGGGDDGGPLPDLPLDPLGRPGFGPTATLDQMMDHYDPTLVGLLLPGVAE